jgi:hypothetical protein
VSVVAQPGNAIVARPHGVMRTIVMCGLALVASVAAAWAQDIPFAFLIQNGWQAFEQPVTRPDQPLVSWARKDTFYTIVNGTKGAAQGTATITAWSRTVPEPLYAAIGPIAGVIALEFPTFHGHLGLIETPTGLQTTVGIIDTSGAVNFGVTGSWLLGNGASVAGGTANDLVVAGIVRFRQSPLTIGMVALPTSTVLPTVAFTSDPFGGLYPTSAPATNLGNFYGQAQGPLRWYRRSDAEWTGQFYDTSVMVMGFNGGSYLVMVCAETGAAPQPAFQRCTVSGVGPMLAALTGAMPTYSFGGLGMVTLQLQLFSAP